MEKGSGINPISNGSGFHFVLKPEDDKKEDPITGIFQSSSPRPPASPRPSSAIGPIHVKKKRHYRESVAVKPDTQFFQELDQQKSALQTEIISTKNGKEAKQDEVKEKKEADPKEIQSSSQSFFIGLGTAAMRTVIGYEHRLIDEIDLQNWVGLDIPPSYFPKFNAFNHLFLEFQNLRKKELELLEILQIAQYFLRNITSNELIKLQLSLNKLVRSKVEWKDFKGIKEIIVILNKYQQYEDIEDVKILLSHRKENYWKCLEKVENGALKGLIHLHLEYLEKMLEDALAMKRKKKP